MVQLGGRAHPHARTLAARRPSVRLRRGPPGPARGPTASEPGGGGSHSLEQLQLELGRGEDAEVRPWPGCVHVHSTGSGRHLAQQRGAARCAVGKQLCRRPHHPDRRFCGLACRGRCPGCGRRGTRLHLGRLRRAHPTLAEAQPIHRDHQIRVLCTYSYGGLGVRGGAVF